MHDIFERLRLYINGAAALRLEANGFISGNLFSLDIYKAVRARIVAHMEDGGYGYAGDWSVRRRVGARDRW